MHLRHFKVHGLWQTVPLRAGRWCDWGGKLRGCPVKDRKERKKREGDRHRERSRLKGRVNRTSLSRGLNCQLIGSDSSEQRDVRFVLTYSTVAVTSIHKEPILFILPEEMPIKQDNSFVYLWEKSMSSFYVIYFTDCIFIQYADVCVLVWSHLILRGSTLHSERALDAPLPAS